MRNTSRTLAAGFLSLLLVGGGVTACSGGGGAPSPEAKSDVAACEALETASATLLEDESDDEDAAFYAFKEELDAASGLAEDADLAGELSEFGTLLIHVLESDDEDDSDTSIFDMAIIMKNLSATCAEEGVDMENYDGVLEEMGFDEFTVEELEGLLELIEMMGDLEED